MKIIDAPVPKSKSAQMRDICNSICGKNQGVYIEFENEKNYFCKIALRYGFKTKSKIQKTGGWIVWIIKK